MKVKTRVHGQFQDLDLVRVRSLREVNYGDRFLAAYPCGSGLCEAEVKLISGNSVTFREVTASLVPWVWTVRERDLYRSVYKIVG